ncbi:MAG: hypothetical protein B6D57_00970 [Candidatus Coatesbacteria bacterium 4484_99]|uniref:Outer membrane protein beta-barrel domain-containing protein n=1 Tax=Candidatus Coatesbacteria bacterium 4484_99 TaxID=1970774 RepID=A0A1W9S2P6_9BACT|nr:MAG: hypothetical protein B6D57_00970 [Candidatus Coatesbacteria bacterium 4484_99]RLC40597.1 MAG: hypothetical protein DRH49_06820 [Candidatus Coatesbacteria bacterium]RLC42087.1 MAG: hypothetical protein DRH51_01635 [Candidatus Coatesbacteria bacterium]RLC43789.1 MAG: hypothetical protein DRH44_04255 [Candidatus Coatesbacteria bacterium]
MRKLIVAIAAVGLIGSFSASYAISVGAGGGWMMGMGVSNFDYKIGVMNFGGGVCIGVIPMLSIEGGFDYHVKYLNKETEEEGIVTMPEDAMKTSMMVFGGGARINFIPEGSFRPYAGGGVNYYMMKTKDNKEDEDPVIADTDDNNVGIYFGGGVNYFINEALAIHIPVKLHYILVSAEDDEEVDKPLIMTFGAGIEYYFM